MFGCELLIGVTALVFAVLAWRRVRALENTPAEIAALRAEIGRLKRETRPTPTSAPEPAPTPAPAPGPAPAAAAAPGPVPSPAPWPAPVAIPAPQPVAPTAPQPVTPTVPPSVAIPPAPRLEERIASRLPVWIGSVALFLAGAFLVKYSFDRGLLGPGARVTLGLLFGVVLLAGGEWFRARVVRIAQGLSASGIAVLYASLLAATALYALVPRPVGFGLLALTTAAAVLLSLRHGPLIAVLGLVGGFVTPALIGTREPSAAGLFAYLFLLQAGLLAAARPRRWWPLAALTSAGGALWAAAWLAFSYRPGDELPVGLFLAASLAMLVVASRARGGEARAWGEPERGRGMILGSGVLALGLLVALADKGGFGTLEWVFLGLVAAGCIVLARLDEVYLPLPWIAMVAGLAGLLLWNAAEWQAPAALGWTALGYGGLLALGSYAALRAGSPARPAQWASLSGAAAVLYFLAAWYCLDLEPRIGWGVIGLALAALYVGLSVSVARRGSPGALAALAAAATVFVSAAVPLELERYTLTVAWALEIAALAFIESKLRVRALRWLAAGLGALVLARLLFNPFVQGYAAGAAPVFNWILYGYGVPALALFVTAFLWRTEGPSWWDTAAEWGGAALTAALLALEVRHWFHVAGAQERVPSWLFGPRFEVAEAGAIVVLWLLLGLGLLTAARQWPRRSLEWAGRGLSLGTLLLAFGFLGIAVNPLLQERPVGATPVFNAILFAYGLPALLALALARELARRDEHDLARLAGVASLLAWLGLILLEVRQAFHGTILAGRESGNAELYTYSAALVLFATVLLILAIVTRGVVLRWASLAVMLLAVAKVFLFDMSALRDLYRVFSFLGLGVSLLVIAYLYQRFVFREAR